MFDIKQELKKLPDKPGVYIMRNSQDTVIYVGKAISLKNRVRQYFQKSNKTVRIEKMVSLIDHFEYIVVENEVEALILECNLIKKYMPKFNVLLKDDKTYPYIKVTIKDEYPTVFMTRRKINDGAKYFGPYTSSANVKEMIDFIKKHFKIRLCKNFKTAKRECLNYHIKKCLGPCKGHVSKEEYHNIINQIIDLLDGKSYGIIKQLDEEIKQKSAVLDFENAAVLRDRKIAIENLMQKQKISNLSENDIDVIGLSRQEDVSCIQIFFVRNSKMIGRENYFINHTHELNDNEIVSSFIKQYYLNKDDVPSKIMLRYELEDSDIIEKWLSEKAGRKVNLKVPKIGEKVRFIEMAEKNSQISLTNEMSQKYDIVLELKKTLNLKKLPRRIESYDISNISGTNIVAGMVVAIDGKLKKNLYRKLKIKDLFDQDDPRCMEEAITRRLRHTIEDKDNAFGEIPDVIFVDGGILQMIAAQKAVNKYDLNISIFGMVKDDRHRTRALIDKNKNEIELNEKLMNFVTNIQDEVHNTAITYHKSLREKQMVQSKLDTIKGVGEEKRKALLIKFGDIENIKNAQLEEIADIKGINLELAQRIKDTLNS